MEQSISIESISCKLFYNQAQEFNRDLSVLVLDTFLENELVKRSKKARKLAGREMNILDALSASGLRGIRYAKELANLNKINKIYMNDLSPNAIKVMKHNVKFNELEDRIEIENLDANYLMYKSKYEEKPFLCVDLDPYGSAGNFLDALVQSTYDGGLLMVTATDVAILCGNAPESCFAKYGSMSMKGNYCHEFALRILLRSIDQAALRYGRYIVPLLSLSIDFYVRVFVQIFTGPNEAKKSANKTSMVYSCSGCNHFELFDLCTHNVNKKSNNDLNKIKYSLPVGPPVDRNCTICGSNYRVAGPIWNKRLHDYEFVDMLKANLNTAENDEVGKKRFNTYRRLKGMIYVAGEELPDSPLFYSTNVMKPALRMAPIPMADFRSAILNAGFEVSQSHTNPDSIKTSAPINLIWDIILTYYRANKAVKNGESDARMDKEDCDQEDASREEKSNKNKLQINETILSRQIENEISFKYNPKELVESRRLHLLRYQKNPNKFWGPGCLPRSGEDATIIKY